VKLGVTLRKALWAAPVDQIVAIWSLIIQLHGREGKRWLGRNDRFFLLTMLLHRPDAMHPWLYDRCREVERDPDGYLDLWAREHYKSTIITYAGIIQEILRDPDITIGIFSHTKPTARKFLIQIKQEFEGNLELIQLYDDVLWAEPTKHAPKWSEEKGLVVMRSSNPKEATLEAHGLVDGQPTGSHFKLLVYDDVVTLDSVGTPEQVKKTTEAWSLSDNLGARGKNGKIRKWHIGTRYSYADSYHTMMEMGAVLPRIYPATDDGTTEGAPVFLSPEAWAEKKRMQIPSVLAAQMLQDPASGAEAMFRKDWLRFMEVRPATLNCYLMVDPAGSKKKGTDFTAMAVVGIDAAGNKWLLDGLRHKMNLSERWANLKMLRRRWLAMPGVQMLKVGYERYGMQSDIEHFESEMERDGDAFEIHELAWPREGGGSKKDRIQRLVPDFKNGRFMLPKVVTGETSAQAKVRDAGQPFRIYRPVRAKDHQGNLYSLNKEFLTEYLPYPYAVNDDLLDVVSRVYDMDPVAPIQIDERALEPEVFADGV
jgi:phage terminase large subunit-like protein